MARSLTPPLHSSRTRDACPHPWRSCMSTQSALARRACGQISSLTARLSAGAPSLVDIVSNASIQFLLNVWTCARALPSSPCTYPSGRSMSARGGSARRRGRQDFWRSEAPAAHRFLQRGPVRFTKKQKHIVSDLGSIAYGVSAPRLRWGSIPHGRRACHADSIELCVSRSGETVFRLGERDSPLDGDRIAQKVTAMQKSKDGSPHRALVSPRPGGLGDFRGMLQRMGSDAVEAERNPARRAGHAAPTAEAEPLREMSSMLSWRDGRWRHTSRCLHSSPAASGAPRRLGRRHRRGSGTT